MAFVGQTIPQQQFIIITNTVPKPALLNKDYMSVVYSRHIKKPENPNTLPAPPSFFLSNYGPISNQR